MPVILQILVRGAEILTIIAGLAGVGLSLGLLFSPGLIRKASEALNRRLVTEKQLSALNPTINAESFALRYNRLCGVLLIAGSIFILLFLFMGVRAHESFGLFADMAIDFLILLGKTAGIVGLVAGVLLSLFPQVFKVLGQKTNICIDTQPVIEVLDNFCIDIDSIILKYSWICGLLGLSVSAALIIIAVVNFLGTAASLGGRPI